MTAGKGREGLVAIFLRRLGTGLGAFELREPGSRRAIVIAPLALGDASKDNGYECREGNGKNQCAHNRAPG